ncbi:peptide/nickel transport system permease protein [Acetitomaculum ruminis DSM 5522]|uniref:Nickel import system permease protein NikB n=1 Tax=Acetitomaculum ruminis DSM 5522 TaxID=1120918 RepID=A0A1I0ZF05_9FIRM|nr:nickel ABC transporter permease [Acetitomaculum ruminis]SFB22998.1 peptide/nickel transport system permease protein [Acetitomaculum ruminis DSM 5522]
MEQIKEISTRMASLVVILFGLSILTFSLTYILPSDPVEQLVESMGAGHDEEVMSRMREKYGLDKPFVEQYMVWLNGIFHGDFGLSVQYGQPVAKVLARKLPNTVILAVTSFIFMIAVSFPLGIISAVYKNKIADYIIRFMSFIGVSIPGFWVGMMLIYLFSVKLHLLPVGGSGSFEKLIMPTLTLGLGMSAYYIRRIRAVMLEQMGENYIIGCLSRGVKKSAIIFKHILPNSLLSIVTMLGMSFGGLLGGTMIVETVFSYNGIGKTAVDAISKRDYQVIQGYVLWMGFIYVMVNLFVDLSYQWFDPRIRRKGRKGGN